MPLEDYYDRLETRGLCVGNKSRILEKIFIGEHVALTKVTVPAGVVKDLEKYQLHPLFLDACCQTMGLMVQDSDDLYMAEGFERQTIYRHDSDDVWCYATINHW